MKKNKSLCIFPSCEKQSTCGDFCSEHCACNKQKNTFDCQLIATCLNDLKVNSLGRIRGKNRVIDEIHSSHLKSVDSTLMDIRVFVAKIPSNMPPAQIVKMIDDFIYQMQVK